MEITDAEWNAYVKKHSVQSIFVRFTTFVEIVGRGRRIAALTAVEARQLADLLIAAAEEMEAATV